MVERNNIAITASKKKKKNLRSKIYIHFIQKDDIKQNEQDRTLKEIRSCKPVRDIALDETDICHKYMAQVNIL